MFREEYLNDPTEQQQLLQYGNNARIWTAIPGIIQKIDFQRYTLEVQPAIQGQVTNKDGSVEWVNLPLLVDVPVVFPNAGGWHITFPIVVGDECLVIFSSRSIDTWWQNGSIQKPIDLRMHDLSDGFAILAPYSQPKVKETIEYSSNSWIMRNDKKTNYIEFVNDGKVNIEHQSDLDIKTHGNSTITIDGTNDILIKGNNSVTLQGTNTVNVTGDDSETYESNVTINVSGNVNKTVGGNVTINISGNADITAAQTTITAPTNTINGNLIVNGNITGSGNLSLGGSGTCGGSMTCSGDVTGSGISLSGHVHGGVESGPSTTGGPQ